MSKTLPKSFERLIHDSEKPVLVDFWAPWCGPCRMVSPIVQQLAKHYKGKIVTVKINIDEKPEVARKHGIQSIPTVMLFWQGQAMMRAVGARSFEDYKREIDRKIG